jgi:hypothetical protein
MLDYPIEPGLIRRGPAPEQKANASEKRPSGRPARRGLATHASDAGRLDAAMALSSASARREREDLCLHACLQPPQSCQRSH